MWSIHCQIHLLNNHKKLQLNWIEQKISVKTVQYCCDLEIASRPQKMVWTGGAQWVVSWCFERSQPLGITSGLKTNSSPSLSYFAHKSFKTNHNFSTAQLKFSTHTNTQTQFLRNQNISVSHSVKEDWHLFSAYISIPRALNTGSRWDNSVWLTEL